MLRLEEATAGLALAEIDRRGSVYLRWLQTALNKVGGASLVVDGRLGPGTIAAVRAFQSKHGLAPDGIAGPLLEKTLVAAGAPAPARGPSAARAGTRHPEVNTALPTPGPGYRSYKPPSNQYGIQETIRAIRTVGATWNGRHPGGPRISVGDISLRGGGPMAGHKSHQHGVDFDIRPMRSDGREDPVKYNQPAYSRALTQELVDLVRTNNVLTVEYIFFNDKTVVGVRHWPNHDDHLHVRFFLPARSGGPTVSPGGAPARDRRNPAYIRWLQVSLNKVSGAGLAADGLMSKRTQEAVKAFQARSGLVVDGVAGPRLERALVAAGASAPPGPAAAPTCGPPPGLTAPDNTVLRLTSRFEVGVPFACVVSATDGISMGMLQWNLKAGTLQSAMRRFESAGGRLDDHFGAESGRLRRLLAVPTKQAVDEAKAEHLATRWRQSLGRLCSDSRFCNVLQHDVLGYLGRAKTAARTLGLRSVRGLSMCFDVAVGDGLGAGKVRTLAKRITDREASLSRRLTEREKLVEMANGAADLAGAALREERRARRLLIANGHGVYRKSKWNLDLDFPTLDQLWE